MRRALLMVMVVAVGCDEPPKGEPEQPAKEEEAARCVPADETEWFKLDEQGCLTKEVVCEKLDAAKASAAFRDAPVSAQTIRDMRAGNVQHLMLLREIENRLWDLRVKHGCESTVWPELSQAMATQKNFNLANAGSLKALDHVTTEADRVAVLKQLPTEAPWACQRAFNAKISGPEDEFKKNELVQRKGKLLADCFRGRGDLGVKRGELFVTEVDTEVELGEYDFTKHAFTVSETIFRRTDAGPVLRTSGIEIRMVDGDFAGSYELLVKMSEESAKRVRASYPAGGWNKPKVRLQVIAENYGLGTVPQSLGGSNAHPAWQHAARAVAVRLADDTGPISEWASVANASVDNVPGLESFEPWLNEKRSALFAENSHLRELLTGLSATPSAGDIDAVLSSADTLCRLGLSVEFPPAVVGRANRAAFAGLRSLRPLFCQAREPLELAFFEGRMKQQIQPLLARLQRGDALLGVAGPKASPPVKVNAGPAFTLGEATVMGSLDKAKITNVLKSAQFTQCQSPKPVSGTLAIKFVISASGSVATAQVAQTQLNNFQFEECAAKQVGALRFSRPPGGGVVVVTAPFSF